MAALVCFIISMLYQSIMHIIGITYLLIFSMRYLHPNGWDDKTFSFIMAKKQEPPIDIGLYCFQLYRF